MTMAISWLVFAVIILQIMSMGPTTTLSVGIIAVLLGLSVNLFTLVNASISETYGPQKTASILAFVNMMAQLFGATGLALSGYMGISLNSQAGNSITEYRGIWLCAMVGVAIMTVIGGAINLALRNRWIIGKAQIETA